MTDIKLTTSIPTKQAAINAVLVALRPIASLLLDAGISAQELSRIARIACIEEATERQRERNSKPTVSSIAAATGLSRAEVRQSILESTTADYSQGFKPRAEDKLLAAWNGDPDFLDSHGTARALRYSGGNPSFSTLVKRFAANIPPRAMLNTMLLSGSVLQQDDGTYIPTTATSRIDQPEEALTYFGAKLSALGSTLLRNLDRSNNQQLFESLISSTVTDEKRAAKIFRELDRRCRTFSQSVERYLIDESIPVDDAASEFSESVGVIVAVVRGKKASAPAAKPQDDELEQ